MSLSEPSPSPLLVERPAAELSILHPGPQDRILRLNELRQVIDLQLPKGLVVPMQLQVHMRRRTAPQQLRRREEPSGGRQLRQQRLGRLRSAAPQHLRVVRQQLHEVPRHLDDIQFQAAAARQEASQCSRTSLSNRCGDLFYTYILYTYTSRVV